MSRLDLLLFLKGSTMKMKLTFEAPADIGAILPILQALERGGFASDDFMIAIDAVKNAALRRREGSGEVEAAPAPEEKRPRGRPKKEDAATTPAVEGKKPTLDDIKAALKTIPKSREKALVVLKELGAEKISDLKEEQYTDFMVRLAGAA